jgi:hypothetical protein
VQVKVIKFVYICVWAVGCSVDFSTQRIQVVHILSSPTLNWKGEAGKISESFFMRYLPPISECDDVKVCISGPLHFARSVSE